MQRFVVRLARRSLVALLALVTIAGCSDSLTRPQAGKEPSSASSPSIVDANHNGNSHFFLLPPLITGLSQGSGTSDGTQRPNVVVCELKAANGQSSCGAIVAQFARRNDGAPGDITYDATAGAYQTNWNTNECMSGPCTLDVDKTYRLRVLIGAYELGHADLDVVSTGKELRNVQTGDYIGLVNGRTLPVRFRIEQGALSLVPNGGAATVGGEGGVVTNVAGTVALDFQNGSLSAATSISISDVTEPMLGDVPFARPVQLGPDGTTFDKPVTLTLAFDGSKVPPGVPFDKLAILVWKGDSWDIVPNSVVNTADNTVSAPISHFSIYQVGMGYFSPTSQPNSTEIVVGEATHVYAVSTAYDVAIGTYCDTVHVQDSSGAWVYNSQCTTVSEPYSYAPVGLRVSFFTSDQSWSVTGNNWGLRVEYPLNDGRPVWGYFPLDPSHPVYPPPSTVAVFEAPGYGIVQSGTIKGYAGVAPSPVLRGLTPGIALIWTLTGGQLTGPWGIRVLCADPATLSITPASAQLSTVAPNNTAQFSATPRDAGGNVVGCATTTWTSADNNVASVDANGLVTAHAPGTTTITAKSGRTTVITASATVTVRAPGYSLLFDEGDPSTLTTQVIVQLADGSDRHVVTSYNLGGSGIGSMARFSPDGTKIIYQKANPQNGDLFFVNPDGSQQQLTFNAGLNAGAVFSPNGDRILFLSTRTGNYELWMMDSTGHNQTQLTHTALEDSPGSFSPSGSQIAFTRGNGSGREVWVSSTVPDNDPSYTSHQVTAVGGQMSNVRWSPDGTKLLVVRQGTLYTVDPTAHEAPLDAMTPIPTGGHAPLAPDWSSDGKKIVFVAANEWVIYTMNPDGTGLEKVPTPAGMQENFASFKPGIPQVPSPSQTTISGSLFFDLDQNAELGPDEVGLAGWTVQLIGPMSQTAVTDGNGAYTFTGLTDGDYQVCVVAPAGWTQTGPKTPDKTTCATGGGYLISVPVLTAPLVFSGVDFGWISQ